MENRKQMDSSRNQGMKSVTKNAALLSDEIMDFVIGGQELSDVDLAERVRSLNELTTVVPTRSTGSRPYLSMK